MAVVALCMMCMRAQAAGNPIHPILLQDYSWPTTNLMPPDTDPPLVPQPDNNPLNQSFTSPFSLHNPPGIGTVVEYDPNTNTYNFQYMTGNTPFGPGAYMDVHTQY